MSKKSYLVNLYPRDIINLNKVQKGFNIQDAAKTFRKALLLSAQLADGLSSLTDVGVSPPHHFEAFVEHISSEGFVGTTGQAYQIYQTYCEQRLITPMPPEIAFEVCMHLCHLKLDRYDVWHTTTPT